jgi:hypothetical protein
MMNPTSRGALVITYFTCRQELDPLALVNPPCLAALISDEPLVLET